MLTEHHQTLFNAVRVPSFVHKENYISVIELATVPIRLFHILF